MELLTAAQMRAIEQDAIESGEVTELELMERAGQGVVEAIFEEWPELADAPAAGGEGGSTPSASGIHPRNISGQKMHRAVVLGGPGNNGGDGFVVARLLHQRDWEVEVFFYGDADKLPPDARVNYERWCEIGEVNDLREHAPSNMWTSDVVVDALLGTGLVRPIEGNLQSLITGTQPTGDPGMDQGYWHKRPRFVCVDVPSGLDANSGFCLGGMMLSDLTVTFHRYKLGHFLAFGAMHCGKLRVKDIGIKSRREIWQVGKPTKDLEYFLKKQMQESSDRATLVGPPSSSPPQLESPRAAILKISDDHKYTHGHALILCGPTGQTGAARLAARGALRIGAGLVTLGVPAEAQQEVAAQITAIMMRQIGEARAFEEVLKDDRMNALCLGPGLGLDRARELVPVALGAKRATVLDADALTAYAADPAELFDMLHENCVLTPHAGEFARLFPDIAEKLNTPAVKGPAYSKVDATREAAKQAGCVVLFKGPDTVIAAPNGKCSINSAAYEREAPWLATAGSGDVLAGFITGLLARGFTPMGAAESAAWLHVECALKFGPGLIAEDLPEVLPQVLKDLLS